MTKAPSIPFFIIIFFVTMSVFIATDLYTPALPDITRALHSTPTIAQFTLTIYIIAFCSAIYLTAPPTDRWGRKKLVIIGMAGAFAFSFLCIFAQNMTMILIGRAGQGVCMGVSMSVGNLILRDVYYQRGHTFTRIRAFIQFATSTLMVFSPTIGGHLTYYFGWQSTFVFLGAMFAILCLLVIFCIPETHKNLDQSSTHVKTFVLRTLVLLKSPVFWGYAVLAGCGAGGIFAYLAITPFLIEDGLGWNPRDYGYLAIVIAVAAAIGGFFLYKVTKAIGVNKTLIIGFVIMFISSSAMLLLGLFVHMSVYTIMVPTFFHVIGATIVSILPYSALLDHFQKSGGELIGVYGFTKYLCGAIVSFIAALFHVKDQIPLGSILLATALLAVLCFLLGDLAARKKRANT